MNTNSRQKRFGFWTTLPGVLTALAALLTATGTLLGVLHQLNIWPFPPVPSFPPIVASNTSTTTPLPLSTETLTPISVSTKPVSLPTQAHPAVEPHGPTPFLCSLPCAPGDTLLNLDLSAVSGASSDWHPVKNGDHIELVNDGNNESYLILSDNSHSDLNIGNYGVDNYAIEVTASMPNGIGGNWFHIYSHSQSDITLGGYEFEIYEGTISFYSYVNNEWKIFNQKDGTVRDSNYHKYRVDIYHGTIKFIVDGNVEMSSYDTLHKNGGYTAIGIGPYLNMTIKSYKIIYCSEDSCGD